MQVNCDVIVIFLPIYGKFRAIRIPESGSMDSKTYVFINIFISFSKLLYCKNWKQNWKVPKTALILLLWVFFAKNADISKIKGILVLKGIFPETKYVCIDAYQMSSF